MTDEKDSLRTDVDDFLEVLRKKGRMSLIDLSKELNIPIATVQAWTDFLVEERIVGIEYKFTTPYVYIEEENEKKLDMTYIGFDTKEVFYEKARKRGIKDNQIRLLWLKYLNANKETMKKVFTDKAREKGLPSSKVSLLWRKYFNILQGDTDEDEE